MRHDAEQAFAGIGAWPYRLRRELGLRAAVEALASREPEAARVHFESLAERYPGLRAELRTGLLTGWAAADPDGLRDYVRSLSDSEMGPALGDTLGVIALHHGVEALLAWAELLIQQTPDERLRAKIFRKAARNAARREPLRASDWVAAHAQHDFAVDGLPAVAEAWILVEPLAALEWLETASPAERRAKALELAYGRWLYEDNAAATSWLESTERTSFHDSAVASNARNRVRRAPLEAAGWCEQVIDPETREKCLVSVVVTWLRKDRPGAEAWLEGSSLDREARESLLARAAHAKRGGPRRARATDPAERR